MKYFFTALLFMLCLATSAYATADALSVVNALRTKECRSHLPSDQLFKRNAKLDDAAKQLRDGQKTHDALQRAGYRADQSAAIRIGGVADDGALKRLLSKNYCDTLTNAQLIDIGISTVGTEIAIVLAAPFAPPAVKDAPEVAAEVLKLVNQARAMPRRCGNKRFAAALPVTANERLLIAATAHAKDMAARDQVEHEGSDGSSPGERAARAGYAWQTIGENVAGGQMSAKEVVEGWLSSPGHCANIMAPDFTEMAVAYVVNTRQEIGVYWAQEFGRPK